MPKDVGSLSKLHRQSNKFGELRVAPAVVSFHVAIYVASPHRASTGTVENKREYVATNGKKMQHEKGHYVGLNPCFCY
jgi:hypothetical protein